MRNAAVVATFTDKYGDERRVRQTQHGVKLQRVALTPALLANQPITQYIGARIKESRLRQGLTLEQLALKCGMVGGHPKNRMWTIEQGVNDGGVRMGTLYVICSALGVEPASLMPTLAEVRKMLPEGGLDASR